ncbi:sugar kinase [Litoribacter populi]|uniref:sugar kinase n=1 Tax=Litoribacter populi TaxID=2598460 RepID=UPI00117CF978|nr:sugar kinase [Litoribacter populi]
MAKKVVTLGEIMMRLNTSGNDRFSQARQLSVFYGGAEANVAVSLARWGLEAVHVTALPDNAIGEAAGRDLQQFGVSVEQVFYIPGRMGLYFMETGSMQRSSQIIYDRFNSAFSNFGGEEVDWDRVFEGADCFHWTGITPALSRKAADLTLKAIKAASAKGLLISGDINYRRNLWNFGVDPLEVMPELISYSNLIVAGATDLYNCLGIDEEDYEVACRMAMSKHAAIKFITNTERNHISATHNKLRGQLWDRENMMVSKTYDMPQIVDRVGGGDAYVAGLIYGLLHMRSDEAVEFATAAAVLKHSIPGDKNLASLEEVQDLVKGENVGRLLR